MELSMAVSQFFFFCISGIFKITLEGHLNYLSGFWTLTVLQELKAGWSFKFKIFWLKHFWRLTPNLFVAALDSPWLLNALQFRSNSTSRFPPLIQARALLPYRVIALLGRINRRINNRKIKEETWQTFSLLICVYFMPDFVELENRYHFISPLQLQTVQICDPIV